MIVYYRDNGLVIRSMIQKDIDAFYEAFKVQGWHKSVELFSGYYSQQENIKRQVIVSETDGQAAGYVTLLPKAEIGPYNSQDIPEIQDFNVLRKYQNRGIGNRMLDIAEGLARNRSDCVSLAVGLHYGYGSAQRIYVKRGYIPDGTGVWYKGEQLEQYSPCVNDDDLVLYMKKDL